VHFQLHITYLVNSFKVGIMQNDQKACIKCGQVKFLSEFGINRGKHRNVCKRCIVDRRLELYATDSEFRERTKARHKAKYSRHRDKYVSDVKRYRAENKDELRTQRLTRYQEKKTAGEQRYLKIRREQPGKSIAQETVNHRIKNGSLIRPKKCSRCPNEGMIEAHHDSYLKKNRLKVRWLCVPCHRNFHAEHDVLIVIPDVRHITEYGAITKEIKDLFARAIKDPKRNIDNCQDQEELKLYMLVFHFMDSLQLNIIASEYGLIQKNLSGISLVHYKPRMVIAAKI
jgi:ribosomal protein S27AE